jgi:transketolase
MSVAFPCVDVKVVGTHAGISIGEDGPSQMGIEDVGLACSLPGFTVVVPADEPSTEQAVQALARIKTPAYLRAGRPNVPIVYEGGCNFQLGKANKLRDGKDVTIIANGLMVGAALGGGAAGESGRAARVLDMHTVKPLDDAAVLAAARRQAASLWRRNTCCTAAGRAVRCRRDSIHYRCASSAFRTRSRVGHAGGLLAKYGLTSAEVAAGDGTRRQVITTAPASHTGACASEATASRNNRSTSAGVGDAPPTVPNRPRPPQAPPPRSR